jgi:ferrous-iron efflux pump FieF
MKKTQGIVIDENHGKLMRRATYFSVAVAMIIIIIKVGAWIYTGSLSMLASLADSVLDVIASLINLFAVSYALKPADDDHRFGHGKAEDIASFAQSAFIAGSALFITIEAIHRSIGQPPLQNEATGIIAMAISTILTLFLLSYQKYVINRTNSSVIKADFLHYVTDIIANFLVIISLVSSMLMGSGIIDTILSFAIAAYILKGAWQVGKGAFDNLMDREMPDSDRDAITNCVLSHKEIKGMHDLRTRVSGMRKFIQFHIELDGDMPLKAANMVALEIEGALGKLFPNAEVIVHQDHENDEIIV